MNIVKRHVYRLEFDTWEPFEKESLIEIDRFASMLKQGQLLGHSGRVRLVKESEDRICAEKLLD